MALIENTDDLTQLSELDAVEQENKNNTDTEQVVNEAPVIPEKYKGKSLEDIVKMHQEAEKLIGKQAQEVGEVRPQLVVAYRPTVAQRNQTGVDAWASRH